MNKGLAQELALCESIRRELHKKRFGLLPECCQVFHQRAYYSRERGAEIVVDIAVEVTLPGASTPFFVWVWESKNYSSSLSVDHVEEFHAKLQQIGADKTKATIVLRGEIQKSALAYAAAKGIGIAKFLPRDRVKFVSCSLSERHVFYLGEDKAARAARIQREKEEQRRQENERFARATLAAMTDPNYVSYNNGFFAHTCEGVPFRGDFEQFLQDGFKDVLDRPIWRTDLEGWHWRRPLET